MVRLSAAGWSPPRIATHLKRDKDVVRDWLQRFQAGGMAALVDRPRCGPPLTATVEDIAALIAEITTGTVTWTAAEGATWLVEYRNVRIGPEQVRRRLNAAGIVWGRTRGVPAGKRDATARTRARAELMAFQKGPRTA